MSGRDNYSLLIDKLDQFIRKFYINQIIRGALFTVGSVLLLFLAYNLLEHEFYFSKGVRKAFFYSFNLFSLGALWYWVATPLMHYFKLGQLISHEQAARIIGDHFVDVKDKLLNILQLKSLMQNQDQVQLIEASIQQKSAQIQLVPFKNAIDLNRNRKYLRFALPPLLLLLVLLIAAPSMIKDSARRIIRNNEDFEKAAPFRFVLRQENPAVVQFGNYNLEMEVDGSILPAEVFIEVDQYPYRMTKVDASHYTYTFNNVQKNTDFAMFSGEIKSKPYELSVLKKPNLSNFSIRMDYPAYTGRKNETVQNIGDLLVPQGTRLSWQIDAEYTDKIEMAFGTGAPKTISHTGDQYFTYQHRAVLDQSYKIYISNAAIPDPDSVQYHLRVISDQYPTIQLQQFADSTENRLIYFAGNGSDDYGLSKLNFNYSIIHPDGKQEHAPPLPISISNSNKTAYQYEWDSRSIALKPGDQLSYYFEIFDNDAIHGTKSTKSNVLTLRMPSKEELENKNSKNNDAIRDELKDALQKSRSIQEQMNQLREKMIQEKKANWQDKKELEKLLEKQKEIQKMIDDARKKFEENVKNQEQFEETQDRILEKQEQIQKMFEQLQDPKMQELMDKIQELLQQMEKEQTLPMMEEMNMENKEMEKELDRMMELFKTLEVEHEMQRAIDKLKEMAKQEEQLSEQTKKLDQEEKENIKQNEKDLKEQQEKDQQNKDSKNKEEQNKDQQNKEQQNKDQQNKDQQPGDQKQEDKKSAEDLKKEQKELNEKMEKLQKELKELEKKNEDLERPKQMGEPQEKTDEIKQEMENSSKQMEQKQNIKASKSQKSAAEKMKDMAQSMENQMQQQEEEQAEEDIKALRQLLENLVSLSFDQEGLIKEVNTTMLNTPHYTELMQSQFKLKDDFGLIEDSLQALSKRVFQLESFVTEKVNEIKIQMASAIDELEERNKAKAGDHQQRTMKNVNDLALMLSESMEDMQAQMSGAACANPKKSGKGEGQKPMDKITEGQKGMKEQLEQMKKAMEQGKGAGSQEFAKAAARQAALREALKELQKEKQQRGENGQELQKAIEGMDKTETELVNKKLTNEMMQRQNEILTRLLEAENAERERKQDEKRKSETAQELERKLPPSMQEYLKKREAEIDLYKTVSPDVKPYYRTLIEEYMKSLRTENGNTNNQ
ncbi:MAG: DUF4175 family protein [Saprospiraceae bacterium]|nr:DUF4175 family protein [Saprospiraceae bacterium]